MSWFSKAITTLTLLATASVFLLTATQMNNNFLAYLKNNHSEAVVISSQQKSVNPHRDTSPTESTPSVSHRDEVTIPDEALTSSDPKAVAEAAIEASYEYSLDGVSKSIHTRSNLARSQNNLPPLTYDITLANMAKVRSEDMLNRNYFSHTSPDGCDLACRFKSSRYPSLTWGENLATFDDYTALDEGSLANSFITDWTSSDTHRQNLLSTTFTHEGVGVAVKDNKIIVTVIFARP